MTSSGDFSEVLDNLATLVYPSPDVESIVAFGSQVFGSSFVDFADIKPLLVDVANDVINGEFVCGEEEVFEGFNSEIRAGFREHREKFIINSEISSIVLRRTVCVADERVSLIKTEL